MRRRLFLLTVAALLLAVGATTLHAGSQQTSSTYAATIITNARAYMNEETADFWSEAELLVWLNDGLIDVAARTRCMETTESVTLVTGTLEYTLSTNYLAISGAVYYSGTDYKGLKRSELKEIGRFEAINEPEFWYEWNGKIGIYPVAVSATSGKTVTVYLVERPSGVTTYQYVTTPAFYDKALTYYIAAQAFLKDRRQDGYKTMLDLYFQELDRYRADFGEKPKEQK